MNTLTLNSLLDIPEPPKAFADIERENVARCRQSKPFTYKNWPEWTRPRVRKVKREQPPDKVEDGTARITRLLKQTH